MTRLGSKKTKQVVSRRGFLEGAASTASLAMLGLGLGRFAFARSEGHKGHEREHEELCPADEIRHNHAVRVRRDVGGMDSSDPVLACYRKAITKMQALPTSNPLSWAYQAAIHGTTLPGSYTSWNTCEHWTHFFWSWHRMYLYWFERIVRHFCGDCCWALPYWNWAPGTELKLPAPFRDPSGDLYTVNRNPAMNSGAGSLNPFAIDISGAFSSPGFITANSVIQNPHGSVHIEVGGWMGSVSTAAQDPIFYLHHSNVDRLWDLWLAQGGGRSDPVTDATWTGKTYTFFNEHGHAIQMNTCEILRAARQLDYVYEGEPPQVEDYCAHGHEHAEMAEFRIESIVQVSQAVDLTSQPTSVPLDFSDARARIGSLLAEGQTTLLLDLAQVETDTQPGVAWAVYVGPEAAAVTSESPYFVGSLALFGAGVHDDTHHNHPFQAAHFVFPLNRALEAWLRSGGQKLVASFVPVGILVDGKPSQVEAKSKVHVGTISLAIERRR
jgi:tyrosinase